MSAASEFHSFFDDEIRREIFRGVFAGYYSKNSNEKIVIDTNRTWSGRLPLIRSVFPESKIICTVRDIPAILESVEALLRSNPMQVTRVFDFKPGGSVYSRIEALMNSENGLVGLPWSNLRELWFGPYAKHAAIIDYDAFVAEPKKTIDNLYAFLGLKRFEHDFDSVAYDSPKYDADLGLPGLHRVKPSVRSNPRPKTLPPDVWKKYADLSFWKRQEFIKTGVTIL